MLREKSTVRRGCQVRTDPGNHGAWSCDHSDTVIQSGAVNSAHLDRKSKWGHFFQGIVQLLFSCRVSRYTTASPRDSRANSDVIAWCDRGTGITRALWTSSFCRFLFNITYSVTINPLSFPVCFWFTPTRHRVAANRNIYRVPNLGSWQRGERGAVSCGGCSPILTGGFTAVSHILCQCLSHLRQQSSEGLSVMDICDTLSPNHTQTFKTIVK